MAPSGSAKSEGTRDFLLVENPEEAKGLLRQAVNALSSTMIWTKEQSHVISTHISVYQEAQKLLYADIPKNTNPKSFAAELAKAGSQDCYFSVSLVRANIFFKARYLGHDAGGLRFQRPEAIYKVQRRKDMRLFIPFGRVVHLEMTDPTFPDQKLAKKIYDISAGGLSFIVSDDEALLFHAGAIIKDLRFIIGSRRISADGEVRHVRPQPEGATQRGHKIGVLFTRIDPGNQQWIGAYVFEESRRLFSKLV